MLLATYGQHLSYLGTLGISWLVLRIQHKYTNHGCGVLVLFVFQSMNSDIILVLSAIGPRGMVPCCPQQHANTPLHTPPSPAQ